MALELIKAQAFTLLYIAVRLAYGPASRFKRQLRSLQVTLSSLQRRATTIQRIGEYNLELDLAKDEVEELYAQMVKGTSVVGRLSNIRIWNYFCVIRYADRLAELDVSLKRLLDYLSLPDYMHILEMVSLLRKNRDRFRELRKTAQQAQRTLTAIFAGSNTKSTVSVNGGNGSMEAQVIVSLEGLGAALRTVFQELLDVVIEVKEKVVIFKPFLGDIKFLLYYLEPLIEEIEVLDCSHVELERFTMQMEKGVKLVRNCSKVRLWTDFNKHQFTNKLVGLDQSLRDQLYLLIVQTARKASEVLDSTRIIEAMVMQIEKSTVTLQNQLQIHPSPTVGWEVNKVDLMKETVVSAMSMDEEVELIEGRGDALKKRNENDDEAALSGETTETSMPTVGLDVLNVQGSSDAAKETMLDQIGGCVAAPSESQNRVTGPLMAAVVGDALGEAMGTLFMEATMLKSNTKELLEVLPCPLPTLESTLNIFDDLVADYLYTQQRHYVANDVWPFYEPEPQTQSLVRVRSPVPEPPEFGDLVDNIEANDVWNGLPPYERQFRTRTSLIRRWPPVLFDPPEFIVEDDISTLMVTVPGLGKPTLAKMIYQHYEEAKATIFGKKLVFVTASRRPNYIILQELRKKMGSKVPTFQDNDTAFNWLQDLRKRGKNPFLLVLDAVWPESESFLDECNEFKSSDYMILGTSRSQFARFGSYHVPTSELEHGTTLFRRSGIAEVFLKKIVENCGGLPLTIAAVAGSLCGQPITTWERTVQNATSSDSLLLLQSSIDALDKKSTFLMECFSDLGSFPEDQSISVAALVDIWAEIYEPYELRCVENIHEHISRGLVNAEVIRKEKMEADFLKWRPKHVHKTLKIRLSCISTDGLFCGLWDNMQLPKAEVVVLHFAAENYALPESVKEMNNLKVLILKNYGLSPAEISNFELLGSLSNVKRIRLERICIPSLNKNSPIQLKMLQKMSLFMCSIGQAFSSIPSSIQVSEAFPNLLELDIDFCDDMVEFPAAFCDLFHLRVLDITNCHKLFALPQEIRKLGNLQMLSLRSCSRLSELPTSLTDLKSLSCLDISYCSSIDELPEDIGEMSNLRKIKMNHCPGLRKLPGSIHHLDLLQEVTCDEDAAYLWEPLTSTLKNLQIRVVKED